MIHRAEGLYRVALAAGLTLAATLGMSIAAATPVAAATTHHVTMNNFTYCVEGDCSNHTLTVSPGDTVVWNYADSTCDLLLLGCPGHTAFSSPTMHTPSPTSYSRAFGQSGTYTYTCAYHGTGPSGGLQHMDGAIVVQAAGAQGNGSIVGTTNSVSSDELPNTFVPGLPLAGHTAAPPSWLLLALAVAMATTPAVLLISLRLAARRT